MFQQLQSMYEQKYSLFERTFSSQLMTYWYTANYQYRKLFQYDVRDEAFLLGKGMRNFEQIKQALFQTLWFTYRKDFDEVKIEKISVTTDSGWGCMIRVGQMMIAELGRRHMLRFYDFDLENFQEALLEFCMLFCDIEEEVPRKYPFSVQRIIKEGFSQCQKLPREWYSPNQIAYIMGYIMNCSRIQNLAGMHFMPVYDNFLDITLVIQAMCLGVRCRCEQKQFDDIKQLQAEIEKIRSETNFDDVVMIHKNCRKESFESSFKHLNFTQDIKKELEKLCNKCFKVKQAVSICLLCRIGCDQPNQTYISVIKSFMRRSYFAGLLGGRPTQANFIVGYVDDKFVCLDPHLVQPAFDQNHAQEFLQSCQTNTVLFLNDNEIDCSCALVFYLKDFDDLAELLTDVHSQYQNLFFACGASVPPEMNLHFDLKTYEMSINETKAKLLKQQDIYATQYLKESNYFNQQAEDYSIIDHESSFEQC